MKSTILVEHNRKLKLKLAAAEAARDVQFVRANQLESQLKVAADIGADRNKYKAVWDRVVFALHRSAPLWWHGNTGTLADGAIEAIDKLGSQNRANAEKVKVLTDKIRELDDFIGLKTAAACENEKKYLTLEKENVNLRCSLKRAEERWAFWKGRSQSFENRLHELGYGWIECFSNLD